MEKKNNISINTFTSLVVQLAVTIQGLIIPRIMLVYFGSSINGLVSSLTQYLNLFAIIEGGISGVILAALYKPVSEKNNQKLSSILVSANDFMKKLGVLFAGYAIIMAAVYPIFVHTYSWFFLFSLTLIIAIAIFAQYYFTLIPQLLLRADDKFYLCNLVQILFIFCNIFLALISVKIYPEVRFLKILSSTIYLIQPLVLTQYIKRHYEIDWKASKNKDLLKQRWDGFGISLANLVTTNTDVIVLTAFTTLETVSVYTLYSQILVALKGLVNSVSNGFQAQIGQLYAKKDFVELNKKFSAYEYLTNVISGLLITCCAEVIVPFIMIYTKGVKDANYNVPVFAFLITLSTLFICIREPYIQMTYCAGFFKETARYAYVEAVLNIGISIILVMKWGLIGVAIGTIVSILYRYIYTILFIEKNIFKRKISQYIKQFLVEMVAFIIAYKISQYIDFFDVDSIITWLLQSCICMCINIIVFIVINMLMYKQLTIEFIKNLVKKIRK